MNNNQINEPNSQLDENKEAAKKNRELAKSLEYLSSSAEVDRSFIVINPHLWIAYYTILFLILLILAWAFYGSISIKVQGKGIFFDKEGLYVVRSKIPGIVSKIDIKQGDFVKKGDPIAEIIDLQEELKLKLANVKIEILEADLERLKIDIESESKRQKESISSKIEAAEFNIHQSNREIEKLRKDLEIRQDLLQQGLIPITNVRETEKELTQRQILLESQKSELITLNSELKKGYRIEEYKSKQQHLLEAKNERDLLQLTKDFAQILSPFDGYVIEILANKGDKVNAGTSIGILEPRQDLHAKPLFQIYGFVPVEQGKRIRPGIPIQIEVSNVRAEEYGKMLGYVKSISEFAVSPEHLSKLIPNQTLLNYLTDNNQAVVELVIEPLLGPSTLSGYKWTTEKGPPISITSGTVGTIEAIVEKVSPFYFVFPFQGLREVLYFKENEK